VKVRERMKAKLNLLKAGKVKALKFVKDESLKNMRDAHKPIKRAGFSGYKTLWDT